MERLTNKTATVAALLVVLLPASNLLAYQSADGQPPAAAENQSGSMVYTAGNATVDGSAIGQSSALLDHAILDSGTGAATITRRGSTVMLGPNTKVALAENNLRLGCGNATVKTMSGMSTLVPGYGVTPSGLNGRYEILQTADHLQISSLEGDLWVFTGSRQVTVPAGQSLSLPGECTDVNALKNSLPGATPTNPAYGGKEMAGRVASGRFPTAAVLITAGAIGTGATIACVEMCGGSSRKPISPSGP